MKANFETIDNYALNFGNQHIDIHNNFQLVEFIYSFEENFLSLRFKKIKGDWVKESEPDSFSLNHYDLKYLNMDEPNNELIKSDRTCVGEITFYPSDRRQENDSMMNKKKPDSDDDIIYFLESEQCIRIHCLEIRLEGL